MMMIMWRGRFARALSISPDIQADHHAKPTEIQDHLPFNLLHYPNWGGRILKQVT